MDMSGMPVADSASGAIGGMGGTGNTGNTKPSGSTGTYGGYSTEEERRYSLYRTTILSVTPQETVTVSITIDELDILDVHKGQEASVTLDALPSHVYTGIITEVNKNASNSGGHSKYSAVVELERIPNMLGGMNASVSITTENRENILTLPAEALEEQDGQTIAYTGYDSRSESLINPVSVTTGLSDGLEVQILSGLSEGDTVWYRYFEQEDEAER
jgi:multidrug efflux pump subunit AcrA (membrane-fusion protein)